MSHRTIHLSRSWFAVLSLASLLLAAVAVHAQQLYVNYDMTEIDDGVLHDASGNNRDATLTASGVTQEAAQDTPWQKYLHIAGDGGNMVHASGPTDLQTSSPFVVSLRFRITDNYSNVSFPMIVNNEHHSVGGFNIYLYRYPNNGKHYIRGQVWNGGACYMIGDPTPLVQDRWYHAIFCYDGDQIKLYLDGEEVARKTVGATLTNSSKPLRIGNYAHWNQVPDQFTGNVDSLRIYTGAFDQSFIDSILIDERTQLNYKFNSPYSDGANTYFRDMAGTGKDAQFHPLSGHQIYSSSQGLRDTGVAVFDGSTGSASTGWTADYLSIPTQNAIDQAWASGFSVSVWFNLAEDADNTHHQYILSNNGSTLGGFSLHRSKYSGALDAIVDLTNFGRMSAFDSPSQYIRSTTVIKKNTWCHAVLVFDGSSISLYINGKLEDREVFPEDTLVAPLYNTCIGVTASTAAGPHQFYGVSGKIDELRFFDYPLGADEVYGVYRLHADDRVPAIAKTDVGASYSFDHLAHPLADGGPLNKSLMIQGPSASSYGVDHAGVWGNCLTLGDGETHNFPYGRMPGTAGTTQFNNAFTFAAWIKPTFVQGRHYYIVSCDRDLADSTNGGFSLRISDGADTARRLKGEIQYLNGGVPTKISIGGSSGAYLPNNQWSHVALVFTGTKLRLYLNGQEYVSEVNVSATMMTPTYDVCLGVLAYNAPYWYGYKGDMDQVLLVNRAMSSAEIAGLARPFKLYTANPIRDKWILPQSLPYDLKPVSTDGRGVEVTALPGQYQPATLVIQAHTLGDLQAVTVSTDNLTSASSTIYANDIDIKLVKCWWQGYGDDLLFTTQPELKPELLVNDASWITVPATAPTISSSGTTTNPNTVAGETTSTGPLDATSLQSITLGAGAAQQYWLTVHVPSGQAPGDYSGDLNIYVGGQYACSTTLNVHVPANALRGASISLMDDEPRILYGIYYTGTLAASPARVTEVFKTTTQYQAEMQNMIRHGILYPSMYTMPGSSGDDATDFAVIDSEMSLRSAAGMPGELEGASILYLGFFSTHLNYANQEANRVAILSQYGDDVERVVNYFDLKGYPEPLFYGLDEAKGDDLIAQMPMYAKTHEKGGRNTVAVSTGYYATLESAQTGAGALIDLPIMSAYLPMHLNEAFPQNDLDAVHGDNNLMGVYNLPQPGIERPFIYRFNSGLWIWAHGLDVHCNFAYQYGFGTSRYIWNDFDYTRYRDHNFVYPTGDGVVNTIQWEGFRDAVDDVRLLTTLEYYVAACKAGRSPGNFIYDAGAREETYLGVAPNGGSPATGLKKYILDGRVNENNINDIRGAIIRKIQALKAMNP